jgi:hypothetical protein
MQTKNLKYNMSGTIDMEIEHPVHGWIPFTASPDDCEKIGRELYALAIAGELGAISVADPPAPPTPEQLAAAEQKAAMQADVVLAYLASHTPAECAAYVQANVTNLATAVSMLSKMVMVLSIIAKERLQ